MNTQRWNKILASAIMGLCLYSTAEAAITVDTTIDADSGIDGLCSLREAIITVNIGATYNECVFTGAPETVTFSVAGTITLLSALPTLVNTMAITGPGAASLTVSGNNSFPIFHITGPVAAVAISDLTITGGGLQIDFGNTGAITDSTIRDNTGGGILNNGTLSLAGSTVSRNGPGSAGIQTLGTGNTQIVNSTISSNLGAGILVGVAARLAIFSSTVTGNGGAGLTNDGATIVNNTIFSEHAIGNCTGTQMVNSSGYNLEDTDVCGFMMVGDLVNTNPLLGLLQNNGGPTFTHALTAGVGGSPAIDTGDPIVCGTTLLVDQRGMMRPNNTGKCDIGAFEWHPRAGGGGGGGCSSPAGKGAAFDPILWLLVLVSCIYLGYRRPYTP